MYLCSNERLYFLKRCVDGLLETVWYGKSLFGSNNRSDDWFVVRKTVVLYFRILGLVSVFSKYTVNHLTQPVRGERFLAGKGHIIHIQSEFAAALLCRIRDFRKHIGIRIECHNLAGRTSCGDSTVVCYNIGQDFGYIRGRL